ncbi:MAG: hypothetical protein AABX23_01365 [Nanoarchaeota archaeon]
MDTEKILRRFERVAKAGRDLQESLIEENKGNQGHFCHIIGNICASLSAVRLHVREDGERIEDYIHRLKPGLRQLRSYRNLLREHSKFKEGEMGIGYFNSPERKPIGPDGKKRTLFLTGEYINYAQTFLN